MDDKTFIEEYGRALHAVQTGVLYDMQFDFEEGRGISPDTPTGNLIKHLRTGLNGVMADHASLARLLITKGVITDEEYKAAMLAGVAAEKAKYEAVLSARLERKSGRQGAKITLG